jgi:transcriptional regulator GlxA family with amidase domain
MEKKSIARPARLQAARDFVERNLDRGDLNPEMVAHALHISVRQLHLLFEPTGMSFSRHVLARRLERARSMLATEPDRKVIAIVVECGIESSSVFYRGFRAQFGVNPTQYRRSLRQAGSARPRGAVSDRYSEAAPPAGQTDAVTLRYA